MANAFSSELLEGLPPHTAQVMRQSLTRRWIVTVFQLVLAVASVTLIFSVFEWKGALLFTPLLLMFPLLALLEYRSIRKLQRVIRTIVEEPHRVTSALMVTHHAPKVGQQRALDIRLSDNTSIRIVRMFSDDLLIAASDEIRAAMGR